MEKTNTPWSFIHSFFRGFFSIYRIQRIQRFNEKTKNNNKKKKNISFRHVTGQLSIVNSRISETKTEKNKKNNHRTHTHTNINIINKTFFFSFRSHLFRERKKTKSKNVTFDTDCLFCFGFVRVFRVFTYSFPV